MKISQQKSDPRIVTRWVKSRFFCPQPKRSRGGPAGTDPCRRAPGPCSGKCRFGLLIGRVLHPLHAHLISPPCETRTQPQAEESTLKTLRNTESRCRGAERGWRLHGIDGMLLRAGAQGSRQQLAGGASLATTAVAEESQDGRKHVEWFALLFYSPASICRLELLCNPHRQSISAPDIWVLHSREGGGSNQPCRALLSAADRWSRHRGPQSSDLPNSLVASSDPASSCMSCLVSNSKSTTD